MTIRVTFDIFSGRPNPVVEVEGLEAKELVGRLAPARRGARSRGRDGGARVPSRLPPPTLGYRGIVLESVGPGTRRWRGPIRVAGGVVYGDGRPYVARDPGVEAFVCGSTGPGRRIQVGDRFPGLLLEEVSRFRRRITEWPWGKVAWPLRPVCPCAPLWEPAWWNDGGQIQFNNNCYNYGTNYRTDTFAQPGLANGAMYASITCAEVKAGAVADALIDSPAANNKCPREGHLVALVVGPQWDFHWYRKGRNGRWTHKPGGTQATNVDNSGNVITDPRTADRGGYTDFCSFMVVMHGHVKIR